MKIGAGEYILRVTCPICQNLASNPGYALIFLAKGYYVQGNNIFPIVPIPEGVPRKFQKLNLPWET